MNTAIDYMEDVLKLPRVDRHFLLSKLIESLDDELELGAEVLDELERRVAKIDSGESKAVSLEAVRLKVQQVIAQ